MTFEELDEVVIPYLGINYRDLSFTEIIIVYNGIIKSKVDDREFLMKTVHNAARMQAFFSVRSAPFLKHPPKRPEELVVFPWETEANKLKKPNPEQWAEWNKMKIFPDKL